MILITANALDKRSLTLLGSIHWPGSSASRIVIDEPIRMVADMLPSKILESIGIQPEMNESIVGLSLEKYIVSRANIKATI